MISRFLAVQLCVFVPACYVFIWLWCEYFIGNEDTSQPKTKHSGADHTLLKIDLPKGIASSTLAKFCCMNIIIICLLDQVPTLPELLQLKIPQHVGTEYKTFGAFLLHDKTGSRVNSFRQACLGDPENITTRILEEWLVGKGKPCTWQILIKTLRDCEFTVLADKIEESKK